MDPSERGRLLYKLADLMERDRVYIAVSFSVSIQKVRRCSKLFIYFAEFGDLR
jgi:hypothetical protein